MSWSEEVRASLSSWRKYQDGLRTLRKIAEEHPAATALAFDIAAEELRRKALADLYYFGVASPQARYIQRLEKLENPRTEADKEALFYETYYHDRKRYEELVAQGFFDLPKEKEDLLREGPSLTFDEELGATLAAMQHETYKNARHEMRVAGETSRAGGQGYFGVAVCEAFLKVSAQSPVIFAGVVQEKWGGDSRTRHMAAMSLTGWVASRISLTHNLRLKTALEDSRGNSAFERLVEVLPGAVMIEWAALERGEPISALVTRSALRLEKEGDEAGRLRHAGKLGFQQPDEEDGIDEPDLEEFTLREELRALKVAAKLSDQEYQVLQLRLEGDLQRTVAEKLDVTLGAVKKAESRARTKLKQAAGQ